MSFRLKTILGIALLQGLLLVILVWSSMRLLYDSSQEQFVKRAYSNAQLLAHLSAPAVIATDLATINTTVDQVVSAPGVVYARVRGTHGVLAEQGDRAALARPYREDYRLRDVVDGVFDAGAPIIVDGHRFGAVEIGLSVAALRQRLHSAAERIAAIAISGALLVLLFSYLLGSYLTRQLLLLRRGAQRIARDQGNSPYVGVQIPVYGRDELAETAAAFNAMSQRIEQNHGALVVALEESRSVNQRLQQSEERYRQLFDRSRAIELLIDPEDGAIVDANDAAVDYYGYARCELRRLTINDINILTPQQVAAEMALARSQQRDHFYFRHRLASGAARDVEVHSGPIEIRGRQLLYSIVHDITERVEAEQALRSSEEKYRAIVSGTAEGYLLTDAATQRIIEVNDALCGMLGYDRADMVGRQVLEFAAADSQAVMAQQLGHIASEDQRCYDAGMARSDGITVLVRINAATLRDADGAARYAFAFLTDITEQKRSEEQLRLAANFFANTSEAIVITDANNCIVTVNPAFSYITGYVAEEVIGRDPKLLHSGRHNDAFYRQMWVKLERSGHWQGEIWNRRKSGDIYPEWLSIVAIKNDHGEVYQYLAIFSDITRRKRDEQKIWHQANFDALTGLPNRTLFMDRLNQALQTAHHEKWPVVLMFLDLDRFKWVNDTMGHSAGDHLLLEVAKRLRKCVNEMATVARLGGDEFTVVLPNGAGDAEHTANEILQRLAEPILIDEHETFVSGSIGITVYPADARTIEGLMRNADSAMYRAKQAGRNTYRYFTQEMNDAARRRLALEHDLRRAQERNELELHFQPIVDGHTAELVGAEALLRWRHPTLGMISPDEFIPLAEEIGAIIPIGKWVLQQAVAACVRWRRRRPQLLVSVNVSSEQCRQADCAAVVQRTLEAHGLPAQALKLEITERLMLDHTEHVLTMLGRLREAGVHLAVDDFGTGYSSLSYVKRFPVDLLKIDRDFVDGLPDNADNVALVEAIIAMAHSLDLKVVAEGVETVEQETFLRGLGCDLMQGFYYARPLAAAAFEAYMDGSAGTESP